MVLTKKHILLATAALTLAACSTTPDTDSPTPAADKTPVDVSVSLADVSTKTRAADGSFDDQDKLVVHFRRFCCRELEPHGDLHLQQNRRKCDTCRHPLLG